MTSTKKCSKCGSDMVQAATHGAGVDCRVKWCDDCWNKFWASPENTNCQVVLGVNLVAAERTRNLDSTAYHRFYDEQARCLAQWVWGCPPPVGLVLGELISVRSYT